MRLLAFHDREGNIVGLAASSSDDIVPAEVVTDKHPGLRAAEVEVPSGITLDFEDPMRLNEALDRSVATYRVDGGALREKV